MGPVSPISAASKTIAVDLDDTLNNFSETLRSTPFSYSPSYNISRPSFDKYLAMVRQGHREQNNLLSTEYAFFSYQIYSECYKLAVPLPGAVDFIQWLRANGWRIVILTHRDLRRCNDLTQSWLADHQIPFDYLFHSLNKLEFCNAWQVGYLIDCHLINIGHDQPCDIQVFYPVMPNHETLPSRRGAGFRGFEELKQWIPS